jgi:hypothetical protein
MMILLIVSLGSTSLQAASSVSSIKKLESERNLVILNKSLSSELDKDVTSFCLKLQTCVKIKIMMRWGCLRIRWILCPGLLKRYVTIR